MSDRKYTPAYKWLIGLLGHLCAVAFIVSGCTARTTADWELVHKGDMPHSAAIGSIFFIDKNEGWALTWAGLFKLRDEGKTWVPVLVNEGGRRTFYSFTFMSSTSAVVVGTQVKDRTYTPLILKTSDGGESWHEGATDITPELDRDRSTAIHRVAFCDANSGWAVGPDLILHSIDGGLSWTTQRTINPDEGTIVAIGCLNPERAWAAGTGGLLLKTGDRGSTWTKQQIGTSDTLMQVRFFHDNGWIVGGKSGSPVLYRSSDGGENWQHQHVNVPALLFDIFFSGNHGWIVGENGTMLKTDDGGRSWLLQPTPTKENLTSLFFLTQDQGWVAGDRMTVLHLSK